MKRIEVFGCLMDAATISYLKSFLKGTLFRVAIYSADEIFLLSPWWKRTYRQLGITKNLEVISNPLPAIWEKRPNMKLTTIAVVIA